jgi:hypothetical protein
VPASQKAVSKREAAWAGRRAIDGSAETLGVWMTRRDRGGGRGIVEGGHIRLD